VRLPDAVYALVGAVLDERSGVVRREEFQRWALSVPDTNPLYFEPEYARTHGYSDVIMPPMFISQVVNRDLPLSELRPDGAPEDLGLDPAPFSRRMAGGEEIRFGAVAYPGDVITAVRTLAAVTEKSGRSGTFALVTRETEYRLAGGALVANIRATTILR
jgi:acyl dehydratase